MRYLHILFLTIMSLALLSASSSYSAEDPDSSSFMDLLSSVNELSSIVKKTSNSTVMVVVYDATGREIGSGSGFFMDHQGNILTNAFVIKDAYSAEVFSKSNHYDNVTIVGRDENLDLALIRVRATNETPLELASDYKMEQGERVVYIGKARTLNETVSEGLISSVYNLRAAEELVNIQPTESILSFQVSTDGPLLNMKGHVIGMTVSKLPDNQNLNVDSGVPFEKKVFAVNINIIKAFASRPASFEHLHPPRSKVWGKWFIWRLKTKTINTFIALYEMQTQTLVVITLAITVLVLLSYQLYQKLKKDN